MRGRAARGGAGIVAGDAVGILSGDFAGIVGIIAGGIAGLYGALAALASGRNLELGLVGVVAEDKCWFEGLAFGDANEEVVRAEAGVGN